MSLNFIDAFGALLVIIRSQPPISLQIKNLRVLDVGREWNQAVVMLFNEIALKAPYKYVPSVIKFALWLERSDITRSEVTADDGCNEGSDV